MVQGTRWREGEAGHNVSWREHTGDTSRSPTVSTILQQIAEQAVGCPDLVFSTLAHHMGVDFLREAYARTRKDSAPGVDRVTAEDYARDLESNLVDLHERLRSGKYRAPPVERVWIAKEDGKQRPIGKPTFEDKIVQRAVHMLMSAVYEKDFHDFSYGFRAGISAHKALHDLRKQGVDLKAKWIIDADISGFFDNIDHSKLVEIIRLRINDGALIRLIGKWLNAGVLEAGKTSYPDMGTPQGGVISPLLANIFLHHVLDEWFVKMAKPCMKGQVFLIRFADDFVIGCDREEDARSLMAVLPKRFGKFGLTIHPTKTRLVSFQPPDDGDSGGGDSTFDFLGFTHYWGKSRSGTWVIKRRTSGKRLRRAKVAIWRWCRKERHSSIKDQYRMLCLKLRGHFQYYGIRGNYGFLESVKAFVEKAWHYWLSRRSNDGYIRWAKFQELLKVFVLPTPRIFHYV